MSKTDTYHSTKVFDAFTILDMTGTQEAFGKTIDTIGAESVQFAAQCDQLTAGTYTLTIQESDNASDWSDVPSDFVLNSPLVFTSAIPTDANHSAYVGKKQYVRQKVNADSVAITASIASTCILGIHWHEPVEGENSPTG